MLKSATVTLHVKPDATPKFFKPPTCAICYKKIIEDKLESAGIEKVEHLDWTVPVVPVPKVMKSCFVWGLSSNN